MTRWKKRRWKRLREYVALQRRVRRRAEKDAELKIARIRDGAKQKEQEALEFMKKCELIKIKLGVEPETNYLHVRVIVTPDLFRIVHDYNMTTNRIVAEYVGRHVCYELENINILEEARRQDEEWKRFVPPRLGGPRNYG
jgi:hypothetical protein